MCLPEWRGERRRFGPHPVSWLISLLIVSRLDERRDNEGLAGRWCRLISATWSRGHVGAVVYAAASNERDLGAGWGGASGLEIPAKGREKKSLLKKQKQKSLVFR